MWSAKVLHRVCNYYRRKIDQGLETEAGVGLYCPMEKKMPDPLLIAEAVRQACIQAALEGYEDAAIGGLCHEGTWEAAISAIRKLELSELMND